MQFSDPNANLYGYGGDSGMPYMGATRQRRRPTRQGGCLRGIVILIVIALFLAFLGHLFLGLSFNSGPSIIQVSASPTLIIEGAQSNDNVSLIQVHGNGSAGEIGIQTANILGLPIDFTMPYQESNDHSVVILDMDALAGNNTVSVTVPARSNVKIATYSEPILVDGITGQVDLTTNSSTLVIQNSTLTGPSLVQSNSGTIKLLNVKLSGPTAVDNNSGDTVFQGSVESGNSQFTANGGELTVTLQSGTATHIHATTNQGNISSTLPGAKVQPASSGSALDTQVGTPPLASLTLNNNQGNITISEQGGL